MANRVVHFEIEAKDMKRATKFYSDAFGWKMDKQDEKDYGGYVVATSGQPPELGINGGIFKVDKKELNAFSCVIGVDDIKKSIEDVKNAGGKVLDKEAVDIPEIGLYVKCEDTEGNRFTLLQPYPGEWMPKA